MPKIPIRLHGMIDYLVGLSLLITPFLFPFTDHAMKEIALAFGAAVLLYSSITDYPFAALRFVPFPIHRGLDLLAGLGLAFAPVHFAAHGLPAVLFVVTGAGLLLLAFCTSGKFSATGQDHPAVPGT